MHAHVKGLLRAMRAHVKGLLRTMREHVKGLCSTLRAHVKRLFFAGPTACLSFAHCVFTVHKCTTRFHTVNVFIEGELIVARAC